MSKRAFFIVIFASCLLSLFVPLSSALIPVPIVDNVSFSVPHSSNETLSTVQIPFAVIVPQHLNDNSLVFRFTDMTNGTIFARCYVTEVTVLVNAQLILLIVNKKFETRVEQCDVTLPFTTMGDPGNHSGTLTVVGTSEGPTFSGTVSLLVSFDEPSNGGIPLINWRGGLLDWVTLSCIVVPVSCALILVVRRRRHRDD